jgi:hypothetical protein
VGGKPVPWEPDRGGEACSVGIVVIRLTRVDLTSGETRLAVLSGSYNHWRTSETYPNPMLRVKFFRPFELSSRMHL